MSKMADSLIDAPVDDIDWDYCKEDKLREEAEQAEKDELSDLENLDNE